ncbi:hypothetical protein BsWGS_26620 [Bradybaena similaris]
MDILSTCSVGEWTHPCSIVTKFVSTMNTAIVWSSAWFPYNFCLCVTSVCQYFFLSTVQSSPLGKRLQCGFFPGRGDWSTYGQSLHLESDLPVYPLLSALFLSSQYFGYFCRACFTVCSSSPHGLALLETLHKLLVLCPLGDTT